MFSDGALLVPVSFDLSRIEGDYALYDDGWRCGLSISSLIGGVPSGRFRSYDRTKGEFEIAFSMDPSQRHRLSFTVSDFNATEQQTYTGYVFTRGSHGIAGVTDWKGEHFGFFACRQPPYNLGPSTTSRVAAEDYLGLFTVCCDGLRCTLELSKIEGYQLHGTLSEYCGEAFPVTAVIDKQKPHCVKVIVQELPQVNRAILSLWMFCRQRVGLAGWVDWGEENRLGCYAKRLCWA